MLFQMFYSRLILFLLLFFSATTLFANTVQTILTNEHPKIVVTGKQKIPAWMLIWNRGRELLDKNKYEDAIQVYRKLFKEKPFIEEALYEYGLALMTLEQWQEADNTFRSLLEVNPELSGYQLNGARTAMALKHYSRAAKLFGQIYTMFPNGRFAIEALTGQVVALQKQKKKGLAYPLMEQLYLLIPHEQKTIRTLAEFSLELGYQQKAKNYYKTLLTEFGGTPEDFITGERLFADSKDLQMQLICLKRYLQFYPYYLPFHQKLSLHYIESEYPEKALPHLLIQIAHGDNKPQNFLQIGNIYLYHKGRPDKALYYYDEYKKRITDSSEVDMEIKRIQAILAGDLLVIVENEGAWNLWRDLARLIPDRLAVYYSMAKQLQKLDRKKELLEVLEIIHIHNPDDDEIIFQLAQLYCRNNDFTSCAGMLEALSPASRKGEEYLLLSGNVEEHSGNLTAALRYYNSFLSLNPDDYQLILQCIDITGRLGDISELTYYYNLLPGVERFPELYAKSSMIYGRFLVIHHLYSTAVDFFADLLESGVLSQEQEFRAKSLICHCLSGQGLFFEAEQERRLLYLANQEFISDGDDELDFDTIVIPGEDTLRIRVAKAEALKESSENYAALDLFDTLLLEYPAERHFRQQILELQFATAKFEYIISKLATVTEVEKSGKSFLKEPLISKSVMALSKKQQIILARSYWATGKWHDAMRLYNFLLEHPVDQLYSERLKEEEIVLTLPPSKPSLWNRISFTTPAEPERLETVMSENFLLKNNKNKASMIAAELYAEYRWQQSILQERNVRLDMMKGNYYQAMKDYRKLLSKDSSTESLYDLAGVYSRLGFYGKEAAVYALIKEKSPGYPNLDEAMQRNEMKRSSRTTFSYNYGNQDGRDGYLDNAQHHMGARFWFMPTLTNEISLNIQRTYSFSSYKQDLVHNRFFAQSNWSPVYGLDFEVGLGAHMYRRNRDSLLYNFRINGKLGDIAEGYLLSSQDIVDDTVEALKRGITNAQYAAGVKFDLLPGFFGGGEIALSEYSDNNYQSTSKLWTSYTLLNEPKLLQFRYGYEFSHNSDGNQGKNTETDSGFNNGDHPYWSPENYWQHLFTLSYKHQLAEGVLGQGAPSYYSIAYSFGYEYGGFTNHRVKAEIYLELSRHLLLNSRVDYTYGSEYKEQDCRLSLIYRW